MPEFNEPPEPAQGEGDFGDDALHLAASGAHRDNDAHRDHDRITVTPVGKRKLIKEKRQRSLARRITYWVVGVVALALIAYGGFYGYILYKVEHNIRHSGALGDTKVGKGYDMLLMGLDTRLDESGKALPNDVYQALHAGDASDGGDNSNVLMYIHVSADGSKAISISIPRDDWVDIANCTTDYNLRQFVPSGCKGKIKSAYGWAMANYERQHQGADGKPCVQDSTCYQQAKDAARLEEVQTVEQFLFGKANGQITSFVEVTMGAFYQIAQQIGKIEVCVKENTSDPTYSGASFKAGRQWITASQAVAFVRQRRDLNPALQFTDLDRSRRQQAFIVSLLTQMKSAGTLLNPVTLNNIVNVASKNVVLSSGIDPISVAKLASNLSGGNLHFYTLPIVKTADIRAGSTTESANVVDVDQIRTIVASLINPPAPTARPSATPSAPPLSSGAGYTVDAVNFSGRNGFAGNTINQLKTYGYTAGKATTGSQLEAGTTITYNPADKAAAEALAKRVGGTPTLTVSTTQPLHTLQLGIGTTLAAVGLPTSSTPSSAATRASALPSIVNATGGGLSGPSMQDLTDLNGSGIPCVK